MPTARRLVIGQPFIGRVPLLLALAPALFALSAFWPPIAQALDDELSGKHLAPLLPDETGGYTLEDVHPEADKPTVRAVYRGAGDGPPLQVALGYGEEAAANYYRERGRLTTAHSEGQMDLRAIAIDGQVVWIGSQGPQAVAIAYFDHFQVGINVKDGERAEAAVIDFLEALGLDRFSTWTPPEGLAYAVREDIDPDGADCYSLNCFDGHVSRCEQAQVVGALECRVTVVFAVKDRIADDRCQLSVVFAHNPNSEWEGVPLYVTVDPAEGFSMDKMRSVLDACVEGDAAYDCEGPLLDLMRN